MSIRRDFRFLIVIACGLYCAFSFQLAVASDSAAPKPGWTTSKIHGSPEPPEPYKIVSAFPQLRFTKPTSIEELPNSDRLLITEMAGKVFSFPKLADIKQADLVVDLVELLPKELVGNGVSLLDAEFHPQFADNRYLFVTYVHPGEGRHTRVSRFTLDKSSPPRAVPGSEQVIITWPAGGHNGGCLEFGTDGYLYISTGDGSGPNPPDGLTTGQTVTDLLGAVLRIDVDRTSAGKTYTVPTDNPFIDLKDARPEIWAYGLRNPFKFGIDPKEGKIFAADNGWETWEMIHAITRGANCGWPVMEGRASLRSEVPVGPTPILPPVKDHPHTEANSVIGGPVYRGSKLPGLVGSFIYGDYITGTIWAIAADEDNSYSCTTLVDTDQRIVAFTQTTAGEVYVLDYDLTGQIYELLPSGRKDTSTTFPRRLSQTGLFSSLDKMQPAPGVVPYSVLIDPWMDGATAQRFVAIPGNGKIALSTATDLPATYPEGTVFVKHLTLPQGAGKEPLRLETQLLHYDDGVWRPMSYLWDDAGHDATLVESIGTSRPLKVADPTAKDGTIDRTWQVNAINECKLCHNAGPKFVLGFTLNQLDRPVGKHDSPSENQLSTLTSQGVIAPVSSLAANDPLRLVSPHDKSQSLDDRARSYLHVNCSMCHHPGGNAIVSFFLRRDLPFDKLNTNKGTGIGTFGMRDAKIIVPGDPYRSVLMYRISKLGYARMPYIGSRVVDSRGVTLIDEWIRSLASNPSDTKSEPLAKNSLSYNQLLELAKGDYDSPASMKTAIGNLTSSTESSLALASTMHRMTLPNGANDLALAAGSAAKSDIRGLFETFIPESKRRATLGPKIDPQVILSRKGDHERGKLIFFSDGARCRNCHEFNDRSKSLGPTLFEIVKKYSKPQELLQHVLQPSLKVDDIFVAYSAVTADGRVLSGLIVEQNDKQIVLKTAERQLVKLARTDIEELRKSDKSLMPDGILSDLTAQEAADLFEYIRSQTKTP